MGILAIGFLEWWSEIRVDGTPHYMKGGKPGYYPDFDTAPDQLPHWIGLNLYDPFKWAGKMSDELKTKRLVTEINNGRLAMLGIMGFLSEQKVPGSVPLQGRRCPVQWGGHGSAVWRWCPGFLPVNRQRVSPMQQRAASLKCLLTAMLSAIPIVLRRNSKLPHHGTSNFQRLGLCVPLN